MDIKTIFLNDDLNIKNYMDHLEGFATSRNKRKFIKL